MENQVKNHHNIPYEVISRFQNAGELFFDPGPKHNRADLLVNANNYYRKLESLTGEGPARLLNNRPFVDALLNGEVVTRDEIEAAGVTDWMELWNQAKRTTRKIS